MWEAPEVGVSSVTHHLLLPCCCCSPGLCSYNFRLTNHGQRTRRLYWATDGSSNHMGGYVSNPPQLTNPRRELRSQRSGLTARGQQVFRLVPSRVELFPGASSDMVLKGSSDSPRVSKLDGEQVVPRDLEPVYLPLLLSPQVVRERLVCRTIVDGHSSYEHVHTVHVTCHFMSSLLSISPEKIEFYTEKVSKNCFSGMSRRSTLSLLFRSWARISSLSKRSWS